VQEDIIYWRGNDYSPEQIKGDAVNNNRLCVSIVQIYQFIWQDKKKGGVVYRHLRTQGKKYQKRGDKKAGRGLIPNRVCISQRPDVVDKKNRIGDLEMDLIIGKEAVDVEKKAVALLEDSAPFLRTITTDNGKEFANH